VSRTVQEAVETKTMENLLVPHNIIAMLQRATPNRLPWFDHCRERSTKHRMYPHGVNQSGRGLLMAIVAPNAKWKEICIHVLQVRYRRCRRLNTQRTKRQSSIGTTKLTYPSIQPHPIEYEVQLLRRPPPPMPLGHQARNPTPPPLECGNQVPQAPTPAGYGTSGPALQASPFEAQPRISNQSPALAPVSQAG